MNPGRWSLGKLVAWVGISAAFALFVLMGVYLMRNSYCSRERSLLDSGRTLALSLAAQVVDPMLLEDRLRLHGTVGKAISTDCDVLYVCVENMRGDVVEHTFGEGYPSSLPALWAGARGQVLRFRTSEGPLMDVPAPILEGQLGTLHVGVSRNTAVQAVRRLMWPMGVSLGAGLLIILVGAQLVAARVSRPLRQLEAEVLRLPIQTGEWGTRHISGTREVESLALGFADMAERLQALERERESTQKHMIRAERLAALGELAAGLAHEVRNPLDGMLECVRLIGSHPKDTDRAAKYLLMLHDGLQRIATVMEGLLTFARSGHDSQIEVCSATEVVDPVALMVRTKLGSRDVRLTRQGHGSCQCLCNPRGLSQAVLNLVLNAVEAVDGRKRPQVVIAARCDERWVHLAVEDSGPGVPEELRETVFEPFFTTKSIEKGTGLGLPISRELVRSIGGEVLLSKEPSSLGGARFEILLPKAPSEERENGST